MAAVMNEDLISNLPDEIIHHILSFLDMKVVVQTCILSKRWKPLCKTLPCLNFISKQTTRNFVNTALLYRDPSANIHAITLHLALHCYMLTPLIQFATLQRLDLQLDCYNITIKLPHCLFTCQSLVNLKLRLVLHYSIEFLLLDNTYDFKHIIYVSLPTSIKLPLLKTLHLESFCFRGNHFIQHLLSGSPLLESLSIINCGLHKSQSLTISTTQLNYLEIDNIYACIGCCGSEMSTFREDTVDIICGRYQHFKNCKVEISAPMLTAFKCRAQISDEYLIHDLSSLVRADIDMDKPKRCRCVKKKLFCTSAQLDEFGKTMMKFIQALHNATSLKLGTALWEVLRQAIGSPPTLYSAKYIKVRTSLSRDSVLATYHLLENSCDLEKLSIEITEKQVDSTMIRENCKAEFPTECRLDQLRFVEISNIQGSENELEFLALLLNKAIILEKLIIVCKKPRHWNNSKKWLKTFIETLQTFQIVSSRAMVLLQVKDSNTRLIIQPKEKIKKLGSKVIIGKESEIVVWDTFMKEVTWVAIDPSLWKTLTSEKVCYNSFARELC